MKRLLLIALLTMSCVPEEDTPTTPRPAPTPLTKCEKAALLITDCEFICDEEYVQCALGAPEGYCPALQDPYDDSNNYVFCVESIRSGIL